VSVQLESHRSCLAGLGHDGVGIVARIELERPPAELLHREGRWLTVDGASRGPGTVEPVEEESPTRDELHRVHPGYARK
jgi:hypothetical protein